MTFYAKKWVWITVTQWKLQTNKPGATPQIFCKVCVKKLTHRLGKILLKKTSKPRKRLKIYLFALFFFFVFTCKNLNHAIFKVLISFSTKSWLLSNMSSAPGQLSKAKSQAPGQVFWANPWGLPSWNWLRHYSGELLSKSHLIFISF